MTLCGWWDIRIILWVNPEFICSAYWILVPVNFFPSSSSVRWTKLSAFVLNWLETDDLKNIVNILSYFIICDISEVDFFQKKKKKRWFFIVYPSFLSFIWTLKASYVPWICWFEVYNCSSRYVATRKEQFLQAASFAPYPKNYEYKKRNEEWKVCRYNCSWNLLHT